MPSRCIDGFALVVPDRPIACCNAQARPRRQFSSSAAGSPVATPAANTARGPSSNSVQAATRSSAGSAWLEPADVDHSGQPAGVVEQHIAGDKVGVRHHLGPARQLAPTAPQVAQARHVHQVGAVFEALLDPVVVCGQVAVAAAAREQTPVGRQRTQLADEPGQVARQRIGRRSVPGHPAGQPGLHRPRQRVARTGLADGHRHGREYARRTRQLAAAPASRRSHAATAVGASARSGNRATRWSPMRNSAFTVPAEATARTASPRHCANWSWISPAARSASMANWSACTTRLCHLPLPPLWHAWAMEMLPLAFTGGWASGINAWATVLVLGLLGRFAGVEGVPAGFERTDVLIVMAVLAIVELAADKIPYPTRRGTWSRPSSAPSRRRHHRRPDRGPERLGTIALAVRSAASPRCCRTWPRRSLRLAINT